MNTSNSRVVNLTEKPLRDFTTDDTLYVRKMIGGYDYTYLCRFVKIERGIIHVAPISCERSYTTVPATMTTRAKNCYLWGKRACDRWERCNWFRDLDSAAI